METLTDRLAEDQIDAMVSRFLAWRLPKPWTPDNGISYTRPNYAHAPADHDWPTGTNLFDAGQAREMILHMLGNDAAKTQPPTPAITLRPITDEDAKKAVAAYQSTIAT